MLTFSDGTNLCLLFPCLKAKRFICPPCGATSANPGRFLIPGFPDERDTQYEPPPSSNSLIIYFFSLRSPFRPTDMFRCRPSPSPCIFCDLLFANPLLIIHCGCY
ncbi:hypothetical protein BYT27DRAFT_6832445 [Phlegmacium glaucopus]|nr:hypothetical protein BYT27DRAFT_6832445 [Phlegmacium glaucopus]